MSDISWQSQMSFSKDGIVDAFSAGSQGTDIVGDTRVFRNVQTIPITAAGTVVEMGDITTPGMCMMQNADDTNFIELGIQVAGTFYPILDIPLGKVHGPFKWASDMAGGNLYARADTSPVDLFIIIYEA